MENMNSIDISFRVTVAFLLTTLIMLTGCGLTYTYVDPIYEDRPHTTEVYWYTDYEVGGSPYFGYWSGFYYYYGIPHYYPWWYYYQFIPPHHYHTHSHIHVHCDNGYYVYGHRGPLFHNIGPDCPTNQGKFVPTIKPKNNKDKSFVFPTDWKSSNSTRINKQNNKVNYNTNKINYNRTFNSNVNKTNNKPNNIRNSNTNRSNNKQVNRSNKKRP